MAAGLARRPHMFHANTYTQPGKHTQPRAHTNCSQRGTRTWTSETSGTLGTQASNVRTVGCGKSSHRRLSGRCRGGGCCWCLTLWCLALSEPRWGAGGWPGWRVGSKVFAPGFWDFGPEDFGDLETSEHGQVLGLHEASGATRTTGTSGTTATSSHLTRDSVCPVQNAQSFIGVFKHSQSRRVTQPFHP